MIEVKAKTKVDSGGFRIRSKTMANIRITSVAGTLSDGTTNFTPEPALAGFIATGTFKEVTIARRGDVESQDD